MHPLLSATAPVLLACSLAFAPLAHARSTAGKPVPPELRAATVQASPEALDLAARVIRARNNEGKAFAVVDKPHAAVSVFDEQGRLLGTSPVLLGLAKGDDSVPGIGERPMRLIKPHERTTPAGRFVGEPGRNAKREDIVWVDYSVAVSMHRVRPLVKAERRLERLASDTSEDNRISYGCINVPADFYDAWVKPNLSDRVGIIYVMPDQKRLAEVFDFLQTPQAASGQ
ncbi:hypothetical protein [Xenophilus azovorans]|uniref:hypothetical protein n=1 Tax=Xenophilus azovorans TaxID=151755 RepID=UPI0005703B59|nr:hypothetical protein [Xenophilus azovorans]